MPEDGGLVNLDLGKLTKPATVLIKKISDAFGLVYAPTHVRRMAKADVDAARIKALGDIELSQIQQRALTRIVAEESRRQDNIEKITRQAAEQIGDDAKPENMDEDWIANFFEKCRNISDQEMQSLWSRLLAGEATKPGSYSKRTIELVSTLDKADAHLFTNLCSFAFLVGPEAIPFVFDLNAGFYKEADVTYASLTHLKSIGLAVFDGLQQYTLQQLPQYIHLKYQTNDVLLQFPTATGNNFNIGVVMLTHSGKQLYTVSGSKEIPGFLQYALDRFRAAGINIVIPQQPPSPSATSSTNSG